MIFMVSLFALVSSAYASDAVKEHEYNPVNTALESCSNAGQKLIDLIAANSVIGKQLYPDGRNLEHIKKHLEQYAKEIDFTIAMKTMGCGMLTPLSLACQSSHCSDLVVELLCAHGANPNEKSGSTYPANCCLSVLKSAIDGNTTGVIDMQRRKFVFLKKAALKKNEKLFLSANYVIKSYFIVDEQEKEFMEDTEIRD